MKIIGFSYDLARNLRGDVPAIKRTIDTLAEFGYNFFNINLEHRFNFPSCPGIAPPSGLTADQAREIVAYGRARGIEVVAEPNVLGHCEGIGATERYAHLCCDPYENRRGGGCEQLNLELPETRALIRAMLHDVCDAFPGDYLHIGCDEIRRMEYIFPGDPERQSRARIEYIDFVLGIARASGRQILVWGDMPLQDQPLLEWLPRDLIVCDWHYEALGRRESLELYKREGFRVLSCPGVSTWDTYLVDPRKVVGNLQTMIGDAAELELEGVLVTQWEAGAGSGFDLIWPWVAMASDYARGRSVPEWQTYVATFCAERYGVSGDDVVQLHTLLSLDFEHAVLGPEAGDDVAKPKRTRPLWFLRNALFRGVLPDSSVGTPSPFTGWLYIRPRLTEAILAELEAIAVQVTQVVDRLEPQVQRRADELLPLFVLARAFPVLVTHLRTLNTAKEAYHRAALAQSTDPSAFRKHLEEVVQSLQAIEPGLDLLQRLADELVARGSFDEQEAYWLTAQKLELNEHIQAISRLQSDGDSLLEFGEFLRRPANKLPQRVPWR